MGISVYRIRAHRSLLSLSDTREIPLLLAHVSCSTGKVDCTAEQSGGLLVLGYRCTMTNLTLERAVMIFVVHSSTMTS